MSFLDDEDEKRRRRASGKPVTGERASQAPRPKPSWKTT
jgi:hypothetical protein